MKHKVHHHVHRHKTHKRRLFLKQVVFLLLTIFFIGTGSVTLWISNFKIPDLSSLLNRKVSQSTKIYDRTGTTLLYDVHNNIRRTVVPFDKISRYVKNATVAIEDAEFYQHHGIKPTSILRAILANLGALGYSQGGSTITQQVVKNSILTTDKTISRKLKEWVLSLKLERVMDKDSILSIYLNESPYGGNLYGVEEASLAFFGKNAADLTLAESAYLASLPNAPTYYSPYGSHKDKLNERENLVLRRMFDEHFITDKEYQDALSEKVTFKPQENMGILAPHFVFFIKEYLEKKYGESMVLDSGLKVITTLDYSLQQKAEEIVKKYALENKEKFNAENAALVAIDPKNGNILAMVGSRDYFDKEIDGNFNVALAKRQPGSSFKPFVYATAFEKGYLPETTVFDVETEFSSECNPDGTPIIPGNENKCYKPQNYDELFRGPISLRNALAQSINIPAIKVLYLAGLKNSLQTAKDMGITTLADSNRYGLTLVLGGGEVSLLDMTSAYGVFANDGDRVPYNGILEVDDREGNILEKPELSFKPVLPKNVALQISSILSDNVARAPSYGDRSFLYFPGRDVAVKTGTTNDYRDAWIMGYTPQIAVGAWAGNNDNSPMEKKVAGFIIAPLWNAFMTEVLKDLPDQKFEEPEEKDTSNLPPVIQGFWQGNKTYTVDKISGKLATEFTPPETKEERMVKDIHSILYWINKNNPLGQPPENPDQDPQFKLWEYGVRKWVTASNIQEENESVIPKETDPIHSPELSPKLSVQNLNQNNPYQHGQKITVSISNVSKFPLTKVDFFINETYVGSSSNTPFNFSFVPDGIENIKSTNTLKIVGVDSVFNKGETSQNFNVVFD